MAQADSQSTTRSAFLRSPETPPASDKLTLPPRCLCRLQWVSGPKPSDPIFAAIEAHKHAVGPKESNDRGDLRRRRSAQGRRARCLASLRRGIDRAAHDQAHNDGWRNCNHELRCPARMFRTGGLRDNLGWS